jgi:hypothetical protein
MAADERAPVTFGEVDGEILCAAARATLRDGEPRELAYRALLEQPVCVAELGESALPGPTVRIAPEGRPPMVVRLVEAAMLGAPVVALYAAGQTMVEAATERGLWPDGAPRGLVLAEGKIFPLLRGHPGALLVLDGSEQLALDAGEVACLADRMTPAEYLADLRRLVASGRPREAARRLAGRPVYTLGHPQGGLLMFGRDMPIFLHLAEAEEFAGRLATQTGKSVHHGLVAAAELFKNAARGKMHVMINPGPSALKFRPDDLR